MANTYEEIDAIANIEGTNKMHDKELKTLDWIMITTLFMFLTMRIAVILVFSITATDTGASIEAVHTQYEANPLFKAMLRLQMFNYVFQFLILPAVAYAIYYTFRKRVKEGKSELLPMKFQVIFTFFLTLFIFINDVSTLVGKFI